MSQNTDEEKTPRLPRYVDAHMSARIAFRIDLQERRIVEGVAPPTETGEPRIETVRGAEPPYEARIRALDILQDGDWPDLRIDDFFSKDRPDPFPEDSVGDLDPATVLSRVLGDADLGKVDLTDLYLSDLVRFLLLTAPPGEVTACVLMDDNGRFQRLRRYVGRPAPSQILYDLSGIEKSLVLTCDLVDEPAPEEPSPELRPWITDMEKACADLRAELHDHLVIERTGPGCGRAVTSLRRQQGARDWWK